MESQKRYRVIGMMSGTSLDGVDMAFSEFWFDKRWNFKLLAAKTYSYPEAIIKYINAMQDVKTSFLEFKRQQISYSQFIASKIITFVEQFKLQKVQYLAIHGHTIFHHPDEKVTVQAANLSTLAAKTKIDTIGNFRELDVMRGGQGAPLAPFGQELFDGEIFLNFGGIVNIGSHGKGWDILYCNLFFNHFSMIICGKQYDEGGELGRRGNFNQEIYDFFDQNWPMSTNISLQREVFEHLLALLGQKFNKQAKQDILCTFYSYLADCIAISIQTIKKLYEDSLEEKSQIKVICTGGGAKNTFLMKLLEEKSQKYFNLIVPQTQIVDFKEAIIFGLLGVKFLEGEKNSSRGTGGCLVKGNTY